MSTPDPFPTETQEQVQGAALNGAWNPWQGPAKPGFWSGAGFSEDNPLGPLESMALKPLGQATAAGEYLLAGAAHRFNAFAANELGNVPGVGPTMKFEEQRSAALEQDAAQRLKALTPDAATTGTAVQTVAGLVSGGYRAALGTVLAGPAGGAALLGSTQAAMRYRELREQGVSQGTAAESAGVTGVTAAAGTLIPGGFGAGLFSKIATGAAANVALGAASRYGDSKILEAAGYKDMADQERVWDGVGMVTDALLGGAFGGLAHLHAAAEAGRSKDGEPSALDQGGARDAALTANLAMRDRAASPGAPVDPASATTHAEALQTAVTQLASNEPVNVADIDGRGSAFVPRPAPETADVQELFLNHLKEGGVLEEQRNLETLERALSIRQAGAAPEAVQTPASTPEEPAAPTTSAERFIADFEGEHQGAGGVQVELARDPFDSAAVHLHEIRAAEPGQGHGTAAMERLTQLADERGVRVTLDAQPLKENGITGEKLVQWYQRFGFRPIGRSGDRTVMERTPESVTSGAHAAQPEYTVAEEELTDEHRQAFERLAHPQGEVLPEAVGGSRAAEEGGTRNAGERRAVGGASAPTRVYRGAAVELRPEHFEPETLGTASGHPSAGLGVFFTNDAADAARYGPVTQHDLALQNPKRIPVEDLPGFDTIEEARAFREQLRAEGHDGILIDASHLGGPKHYAVFEPDRVQPAAGVLADPLAAPAAQAVQEHPGLEIAGEDGQPVRAADALQEAQQATTDAERDAPKATTAAVNCFLRRGGG